MGAGKQDVHFSRQCLEEGVSINRVLQTLVGDVSDQPVIPAKPDAEIPVIQARSEEKSDSEVSQSMLECTGELCTDDSTFPPPSLRLVCLRTCHARGKMVNHFIPESISMNTKQNLGSTP